MKRITYPVVSLMLLLGWALLLGGCEMLGLAGNPAGNPASDPAGDPAGTPTGGASIATIVVGAGGASTTLGGAGVTLALTAAAKDGGGADLAARPTFVWASSDPAVATVSSSGLVTAVANGSATISASAGGKTGSIIITVSIAIAASIPNPPANVVATPGNHEYRPPPGSKEPKAPSILSRNWRPQFALPENGPADLPELAETTYYLDYQGARIVSLNSNKKQAEQVGWLREVLRRKPQRWTVVTFHHPIFSPARDRDNATLRDAWKPVFDEFKVDLVLTGHDHTYARSGDVAGRVQVGTTNVKQGYQNAYDPAVGTVYVVSVSGPKFYNITGGEWAVRTAEDTQLFQVITIDGDELRFEARTATNRLYDAFTLKKRAGRANELIEPLPPERRRPPAAAKAKQAKKS